MIMKWVRKFGMNFFLFCCSLVESCYYYRHNFIAEEAFIPGMGPEDKVENQEQEKDQESELIIPGLDLSEDSSSKQEKPTGKKIPYQKPIPKKFQAIWNDTKVDDELEDEKGNL